METEKLIVRIGIVALLGYFWYENRQTSGDDSQVSIPKPVASVVTDSNPAFDNWCVSKTDASGNWYGIDTSGNCTIEAMGGATGNW